MVMTLKGKHNHYNVKFLKGYGFSVRVNEFLAEKGENIIAVHPVMGKSLLVHYKE